MTNVAVLGLGAMGSRMARRLMQAGHQVHVYNRSPKAAEPLVAAGAVASPTPREAAEGCDVIISMVADDDAARAVWLDPASGALAGLHADAIAIESSTLTPGRARELAQPIESRGARFLAAPVIGSRPHAEAGKLTYLVGGDADVLERVRDLVLTMGASIHYVGSIESALALKLAVNAFLGTEVALLGEALTVLGRAGIETKQAIEVLNASPIASPAMQRIAGLIGARSFAPNFPIKLMEKDLRYYRASAHGTGAATPVVDAVHEVFAAAAVDRLGEADMSGIVQFFEAQSEDN